VFGPELRKLRLKAGLTQEEVGGAAGVTREYVSMLESGKNIPTIDVFIRLCHAVNAYPAEVIARLDHALRGRTLKSVRRR
jgi:transcriptional regulator with XRE-family HTH domain